jgi:hypothetical protein
MPNWKELKRFCENDGWELFKDTDHFYYRKIDENGILKRTKVSKGSAEIRTHLFSEILKKQLKVTKEYFIVKFAIKNSLYLYLVFVKLFLNK